MHMINFIFLCNSEYNLCGPFYKTSRMGNLKYNHIANLKYNHNAKASLKSVNITFFRA